MWANYPRRRQDGVWTPNLRGRIALHDGSEVLVSIHGQSVRETGPTPRRAILARAELTTEAEPYRWLNTCFLVGEGEIDEERRDWWLDTYVCVNELAQGPPALGAGTGAVPPARATGGRLVVGRAGRWVYGGDGWSRNRRITLDQPLPHRRRM